MALRAPELNRLISGASEYSFEDDQDLEDLNDLCGSPKAVTGSKAGALRRAQVIFESLQQLRRAQDKRVEEVMDCTGLDNDDAFLLLRRHGWDVAGLEEAFFEKPEATRQDAGVSDADELKGKRVEGLCAICFTDPGMALMPCERRFLHNTSQPHPTYCHDCWEQYLGLSVREGKSCLELRCPTPGCSEAVRPSMFIEVLDRQQKVVDRFNRFLAESLVDDSQGKARWCPGQGCGYAASRPESGIKEVACPCGTTWCYGCGTDAHDPVSCETVQRWEEKSRDSGEDATWIRVNTKACPKCSNPIEKNGGCMHMTCLKPGGCGHEFCWICMKNWNGHTVCNATPELSKGAENDARSKNTLMRYGHFYERFVAHHKAQQFSETSQRESIAAIGEALIRTHGFSAKDVKFLDEAVSEIRDCRRFLKWTYAYGFFQSFSKKQQTLFEFHQGQLEGTVDRLSDIMENTTWDNFLDEAAERRAFYDMRLNLVNLTDVVHQFFSHLQEAIEQGTLV